MQIHDYEVNAIAREMNLLFALRKAELAGLTTEAPKTVRTRWFARLQGHGNGKTVTRRSTELRTAS